MVSVREINENDLPRLIHLARETFVDTYAVHNTEADMEKYLRENFTVEIFQNQLKNQKVFYVAFTEEKMVGYIQLSDKNIPESLDFDKLNLRIIEIERLYVSKNNQGKAIGSKLIAKTIEFCQENRFSIIWLGVWKKNEKAIAFYKKSGFEIFGEHHFILGDDVQDDFLMSYTLRYTSHTSRHSG